MCVAVIVEADSGISLRDMEIMYEENPHGIAYALPPDASGRSPGIAWRRNLTPEAAHAALVLAPKPALFHVRWATQGSRRPGLMHPFPLGQGAWTHDVEGVSPSVLIHNGTWRNWDDYLSPAEARRLDASDTQIAAWVAGYWPAILDEVGWANATLAIAADGVTPEVTARGDTWETHRDGNRYSNLAWLPRPAAKVRAGGVGGVGWVSWQAARARDAWREPRAGESYDQWRDRVYPAESAEGRAARIASPPAPTKAERRAAKRARRRARIAQRAAAGRSIFARARAAGRAAGEDLDLYAAGDPWDVEAGEAGEATEAGEADRDVERALVEYDSDLAAVSEDHAVVEAYLRGRAIAGGWDS